MSNSAKSDASGTVQPTFDPKLWRPSYLLYARVSEFLHDIGPVCERIDPGPPPSGYPASEIDEVRRKRRSLDADPARRTRILNQDQGFPEFFEPLGLTYKQVESKFPWVHAATNRIPIELARPVLLLLKAHHNAARPYQLDPDLHIVVDNPGHPSYPSGHTCQTLLAVLMMKLVLPERLLTGAVIQSIEHLAADTAVNREYAGLHYESDTTAGHRLARNMMPFIEKHFAEIVVEAQQEALGI